MALHTGKTLRAAALGVSAALVLGAGAGTASADGSAKAQALEKCAQISDDAARLTCFDAVSAALKGAPAPGASGDDALAAREAEIARRQATLAAQEEELARQQAVIEQAAAEAARAAEAVIEAAHGRMDEAQRLTLEAEARAAEAEARKAEADARRAEAEAARAKAGAGDDADRRGFFARWGSAGLPETVPALFGINDIEDGVPEEALANYTDDELASLYTGDTLDKIEATTSDFGHNNVGKAYVRLDDGAVWRQTDSRKIRLPFKGPITVEIRRGMLGSFMMKVEGRGQAIRVERIR